MRISPLVRISRSGSLMLEVYRVAAKKGFVNVFGLKFALLYLGGDRLTSLQNFLPPAVISRHRKANARIALGFLDRPVDLTLQRFWQRR